MLETSVRLLQLLSLLQSRRDWSGAELARRLGVTTRTIRNDMERLRSLGYQVHSSTGVSGGYRLEPGSAMPPLLFDDDEAVAVGVGLRAAAANSSADLAQTSLSALAKLERTLPTRLRPRLDAIRHAPATAVDGEPIAAATTSRAPDTTEHGPALPTAAGNLEAAKSEGADAADTRYADNAKYQARIRLYASAEAISDRIAPSDGRLRPVGAHNCVLETGADRLVDLVGYLTSLDVRFEVLDPPELRTLLQQLADRFRIAAGERPRHRVAW